MIIPPAAFSTPPEKILLRRGNCALQSATSFAALAAKIYFSSVPAQIYPPTAL
ncbi:MAG: hypothetical protein LBP75_09495 [Planctomycetota bacterium]|nr:hypothetical protein [Planctomycetota bacterium]